MSDRRRRVQSRLDYNIYNITGKKVAKENRTLERLSEGFEKLAVMATEKLEVEEKKINRKIIRFLKENDEFTSFFDVDDIEKAVVEIKWLLEKYEETHLELEEELGDDQYKKKYENLQVPQLASTWVKNAKLEIKRRKEDEKLESLLREKEKLRTEVRHATTRIDQDLKIMFEDNSEFVEDLNRNINVVRGYIHEYSNVMIKVENLFTVEEYNLEFYSTYINKNTMMNDFIREMFEKIKIIKHNEIEIQKQKEETTRKSEIELRTEESEKQKNVTVEKINVFNGIFSNIQERTCLLREKLEISVADLTDVQIMEKQKDIKVLDTEFNKILDLITELIKCSPPDYNQTEAVLERASAGKEILKKLKYVYQINLEKELKCRDLSAEKVKNASLLKLEVPKFHGYDSKLDYYSFKSEFDKLIVPRIHAKLLPDYLKNNYLEGPALELVKNIEEIEQIWERLKTSFGNVSTLLSKKLGKVNKTYPLWKIKNDEKFIEIAPKLINEMKELYDLAGKHKIGHILFHPCNLAKIYELIGRKRQIELTKINIGNEMTFQEEWQKIIEFLEAEVVLKEKLIFMERSKLEFEDSKIKTKSDEGKAKPRVFSNGSSSNDAKCTLCGKTDHVGTVTKKGKLIFNYFACPKFVEMSPKQRLRELKAKNLCCQCLSPGVKEGHSGFCFDKFNCPDNYHKKFDAGYHILVCDQHKNDPQNLKMLEEYRSKYIMGSDSLHKEFSKKIAISFHNDTEYKNTYRASGNSSNEEKDFAIYMFQTIQIQNTKLNLFYDNGCSDFICKKETVDFLSTIGRAGKIVEGPLTLSGVADQKTICENGVYRVTLPLKNGEEVTMSGICLDKITSKFPRYPLKEVEADIHKACVSQLDPKSLPTLPDYAGGETHLMIGVQYLMYYPKLIFSLPNGLTLYESQFKNFDGSSGVVAGPHWVFTQIHKNLNETHLSMGAYISESVNIYKNSLQLSLSIPLLNGKAYECIEWDDLEANSKNLEGRKKRKKVSNSETFKSANANVSKRTPKLYKRFEEVEKTGTIVSWRCVRCRSCPECKVGERVDNISVQEEVEDAIIKKSVHVDIGKKCTTARLPFLSDPTKRLQPNRHIAKKVYDGQVKKLNKNLDDKNDVIAAEKKLQDLGYVDFFENLTDDQQRKIESSEIQHFIPWLSVWNKNSKTTECRLVFNASHPTESGISLNDLLAKGCNNMNKLSEIGIRWQIWKYAFHTDVRKMYNSILLDENHWCYQLYLWQDQLDPIKDPKIKVIKTLIYGIKSSGNQAERGIRETGNLMKNEYPRQNEIISQDVYVDDCLSGENTLNQVYKTTDVLKAVLIKGGFDIKPVTISGCDPPEQLANDDKSINVAGMKWFPKGDFISLNIGEINFSKKSRGKKLASREGIIPENFTRRDCAGKVAEIFDLLGKFTPLTAGLKLDLSELSKINLDWDDNVPLDLHSTWKSNFELIKALGHIKLKRAIVPEDAISLDMETLEMGDASQNLACAAIYARFKRKSGSYSSQLVFAKSKIIPSEIKSMPRAELFAALLNATAGHVVYLALKKFIKSRVHLTDSQITLFWITNIKLKMKQYVRDRVIEIQRITNREKWFHVDGKNMTADLGTRKGAKIEDISENSLWQNGPHWGTLSEKELPIKSVCQIKLSTADLEFHNNESLVPNEQWINKQLVFNYNESYAALSNGDLNQVSERYKFSHYVIDPNRFRFRKVVRVLALVILFIKNLKAKININCQYTSGIKSLPSQFKNVHNKYLVTLKKQTDSFPFNCQEGLVVCINDNLLMDAMNYFYRKATQEIKHFLPKKRFEKISKEKDGILFYTGRILPSQEFNGIQNLSDVCMDLSMSSFCVPLIDKLSPLAYALINEVHWYDLDANHSGNETVLRYVQKIAFILEGRSLIKQFRIECTFCKLLNKKAIEVAMGPISNNNFCIAPAFYNSQTDLFGPFTSYSNVNKRASIKVWFVIFCCCSTGAVDVKIMEDYSTTSFVLAFVRFSCKVGFPKRLLPDAGSQLVKGCQTMTLTFSDIKNKLFKEYGVEFETCPVGAHYMHGKVERKIRHVKESFSKTMHNERLSIIQWETLGDQIANSINNLPIALGNVVQDLENLDLLTPNRLMLARNNNRSPIDVSVVDDPKKIIKGNNDVFKTWFKVWLISYVPTLMSQPKWFDSTRDPKVGDIVLLLKSDRVFEKQYQYGIICGIKVSRDRKIREVEIEYQNFNENIKRRTNRGVREIIVIHPLDEVGIIRELNKLPYKCT